ncbi:hypothetical protein [Leuconostoc falkenbergense]
MIGDQKNYYNANVGNLIKKGFFDIESG